MEDEFNRYINAADKVIKKIRDASNFEQTERFRSLTYEEKVGVWLNNFITHEINRVSIVGEVDDLDKQINKAICVLKIYKRIAKIHTVMPTLTPFVYIGEKEEDRIPTVTQLAILNEITYHRLSNYKGEVFIYNIETELSFGRVSLEGECMVRYITAPTDKKNTNRFINMSGK